MMRRAYAAIGLIIFLCAFAAQPWPSSPGTQPPNQATQTSQKAADPNDPIARIKEEGLQRSHVMETLSYLSDVIGPFGSPARPT